MSIPGIGTVNFGIAGVLSIGDTLLSIELSLIKLSSGFILNSNVESEAIRPRRQNPILSTTKLSTNVLAAI